MHFTLLTLHTFTAAITNSNWLLIKSAVKAVLTSISNVSDVNSSMMKMFWNVTGFSRESKKPTQQFLSSVFYLQSQMSLLPLHFMDFLLSRSPTLCFRYHTLSVDVRHARGLRVLVAWARTDWSLVLGRLNTGHSGNYHRRQGSLY